MRGEIFNELIEFAVAVLGAPAAAGLTSLSGTPACRSYAAAQDHEVAELLHVAAQIAARTECEPTDVLRAFGSHLFGYFAALYPAFVDRAGSAIALLRALDRDVHRELHRLNPEARFPRLACREDGCGLAITYRSAEPLADLAHGLIEGCIAHFGEPVQTTRVDLDGAQPGTAARFTLSGGTR